VAYHWISKLQILENISKADAEDARDKVYSMILCTKHLITEKLIVESPVIYGFHVQDLTRNSAKINYGILSKLKLEKCVLKLYSDSQMKDIVRTITLSKIKGYHQKILDKLKPGTSYALRIEVTQRGDPNFQRLPHLFTADTTMITKAS
jgi:hypothetical protein